jgi:hypothetical protein
MALDTRIWSMWRRQTSIRSRRAAGRIIAGLRDLGDATFLQWTITSAVRDLIPIGRRNLLPDFQALTCDRGSTRG